MLMITKGSSFPPTATEDVPQEGQKRPGLLPSFFFFFFFGFFETGFLCIALAVLELTL